MRWLPRLFPPRASSSILSTLNTATNGISLAKRRITSLSWSTASLSNVGSESFYSHTSGRWLWNEEQQLARRRLKFNISALERVAAAAIGSRCCTKMEKLSEGSFNKVFLMTMDDRREIIAKLPNPNAGYKHFTTASEVATMDYLRNVLRLPVPRIHSWSSSLSNSVGAEYILMEKCRGVELHSVWDDMKDRQKATIIQKLVGFEATFASSKFSGFGSLYYAKDLPADALDKHIVLDSNGFSKFAIGPTTDRAFFDHGRSLVNVNRGPWQTLEEYTLADALRELACVEHCPRFPDQQGFFYGPGQHQPSVDVKTRTLKNYIKVAKYLRPKDPVLSNGVLWHTDLHSNNIFVNENDPTEITAIIDWQAVHIAPLFAQARHPTFLEFEGEIPEGYDASAINLPSDFNELNEHDQKAARRLRGAQMLWKLYEIELACQCDDVNRAIRFGEGLLGRLPAFAGNVFSDGELLVEDLLIRLEQEWSKVVEDPTVEPCPIHFTDGDKITHEKHFALWAQGIELMTDFLQKMGGSRGWDGWVNHEQYEAGKTNMEHFRHMFLEHHASTEAERRKWVEVWPFEH